MPGCGKSTIGVLLAKALLFDFVDTDLIIQNKYSKSLCDLIEEKGLDGFKQTENEVLASLKYQNCIIATGGSAVYGKEAMENLRKNGKIVYLKLSPEEINDRIQNITTRGIAMENGTTIKELYNQRAPLYEKYADITIECSGMTVEQSLDLVMKKINHTLQQP